MQRNKILIGACLLFFTLLVYSLIGFSTVTNMESNTSDLTVKIEKSLVDPYEAQLYKMHQHDLKVALKAYFEEAIASGDIVGAGVSIVKGDSIVISDGFGKRDINQKNSVDGETVFRLGSLSKGFAGVLAANLKSEGKLHWEDKVSDFIPGFQLGDKSNTDNITLANILSHTSGTPYHSYTNLIEAGLPLTTIAERFKNVVPISKPGIMYSYQNAMFALCGVMVQQATGQDISTSLTNRFFKPLGMSSTTMDYEALSHEDNVAMPHSQRRNGWKTIPLNDHYYNAIAAGGINASALDMGKWMRFLLGHNPELMNKTALKETFNPFVEIKGSSKYYQRWPGHLKSYYAFGWRIHTFLEDDSVAEKTVWHHGGSVNSYRNEIAVYPEADLGICVLLNSNSKIAKTVIPDLHQIIKDVYAKSIPKLALNTDKNRNPPL
ncbi:Protein flp [Arenibacter antarcticus]|uniref:Serine hydrolase domain-containing protein n=1 Tax=Arenibacter antarcticus TaxID=2040469 RepID=A0ABW5VFV4_9FLAO|nr:serine hydrolase domain-containing protein [Arenibacter sp. H213]MCM4166429.1 serine hydrolase [Arenibacter sp. H213]